MCPAREPASTEVFTGEDEIEIRGSVEDEHASSVLIGDDEVNDVGAADVGNKARRGCVASKERSGASSRLCEERPCVNEISTYGVVIK